MVSRSAVFLVLFFGFLLSANAAPRYLGEEIWYQVDSKNFQVITDGDPSAVKTLVADLERYRAVAIELLEVDPNVPKLTIYAAGDRDTYAGLVGAELADMTNGLFDTSAEGSYALVNLDGRIVKKQLKAREFLFHEYTHFLSYNGNTTHFPYWYSEGFAEFMATMSFPKKGRYELGEIPQERAQTLMYAGLMPLDRLLRATVYDTDPEEKADVYASGWLLSHWLMMEGDKAEEFKLFVKDYNDGADPVKSLEKALGMSVKELEKAYVAAFDSGEYEVVSGVIPPEFKEVTPQVKRLHKREAVNVLANFIAQSGYNLQALDDLITYSYHTGIYSTELAAIKASADLRVGNFPQASHLLASVPKKDRQQPWYLNAHAWLTVNQQATVPNDARDLRSLKRAREEFDYLVKREPKNASHWFGLAMAMEMLGYPREEYLAKLEEAYNRAPRELHIAQWLAEELYQQKNAEYFARVAKPLMFELPDEEQNREIKMRLAELQGKPKSS
ncbi:hypothetical protein [Microbulbifer sp. THAF38]|uniref:hypothetical protein n=1 Tax=Microbulbifer sp. THAF38 TaxID=2587856 RepID=UPI0012681CA0|nr:hypothetical protein [Microbulbifer sp. THAF38]QFT56707.1 hypothetical protein FIU95_19335 [Microbulbifer sp. THAF38]